MLNVSVNVMVGQSLRLSTTYDKKFGVFSAGTDSHRVCFQNILFLFFPTIFTRYLCHALQTSGVTPQQCVVLEPQ
jgi:hypothetical protein